MNSVVISILVFIIGLIIGIVGVTIFNNIKIKNSERTALKIIENAKKEADKNKRNSLLETKEELNRLIKVIRISANKVVKIILPFTILVPNSLHQHKTLNNIVKKLPINSEPTLYNISNLHQLLIKSCRNQIRLHSIIKRDHSFRFVITSNPFFID